MNTEKVQTKTQTLVVTALLLPLALLVWWPVCFMVTGVLTSQQELTATIGPALGICDGDASWHFLPSWPTLEPLLTLLLDTPSFFVMFWNSTFQVFLQLIGQLCIAAPASWALAQYRFRGRGFVQFLYIILMLMPFQVTMVPNYLVLRQFGLLDTAWAIILPGIFSTFPVFIMQRGFSSIPKEILEAACIDGATSWQAFLRVGIPLGLPGIISALTLSFLDAWNAIEQPMTFLKSQTLWPLSLYLTSISTENLGAAMAASLIALMPSALIFRFGQKYLELGIQAGAVKG